MGLSSIHRFQQRNASRYNETSRVLHSLSCFKATLISLKFPKQNDSIASKNLPNQIYLLIPILQSSNPIHFNGQQSQRLFIFLFIFIQRFPRRCSALHPLVSRPHRDRFVRMHLEAIRFTLLQRC